MCVFAVCVGRDGGMCVCVCGGRCDGGEVKLRGVEKRQHLGHGRSLQHPTTWASSPPCLHWVDGRSLMKLEKGCDLHPRSANDSLPFPAAMPKQLSSPFNRAIPLLG